MGEREREKYRFSVISHQKPAPERVGVVGVAQTQTGQGLKDSLLEEGREKLELT